MPMSRDDSTMTNQMFGQLVETKLPEFLAALTQQPFSALQVTILKECRLLRELEMSSSVTGTEDDIHRSRHGFGLLGGRSHWCRVKLQSPRADRQEWINVFYDSAYSADACFHFEVHWLAASGTAVDNFVQEIIRKGKASGIASTIVEIPSDQPLLPQSRALDPFHSVVKFPVRPADKCKMAQYALLKQFEFFPDGADCAMRQYIHKTGMALVREVSDGLVWIGNYLTSSETQQRLNRSLFRSFRNHCAHL